MLPCTCQGEAVASSTSIAALLGLNACVVAALCQFVFCIGEHTYPTGHICLSTMSQHFTPEPKLCPKGTLSTLQVCLYFLTAHTLLHLMQFAVHPRIACPSCSDPARASGSSSAEEDDAADQEGNRAVSKMQPSAKSQAQLAPQAKKLKPSAIYRKKKKHAGGQGMLCSCGSFAIVSHTDLTEVTLVMDRGCP